MVSITFDTLGSANRLKAHGFTMEQAEAVVAELKEARDLDLENLATKADLQLAVLQLQNQIKDLFIKLGAMISALGGLLVAIKYFG